jgi:polygalacturonase
MRRSSLFALLPIIVAATTAQIFDVRTFGAIGDGVHNDTLAFQAAFDAAALSPGSTVLVSPCADAYLSWPLLWDGAVNATLLFAMNSSLRAAPRAAWPTSRGDWLYGGAFLTIARGSNLTLIGAGQFSTAIDGDGNAWWVAVAVNASIPRPNPLLRIFDVTSMHIHHLQFKAAPMFHVTLENSRDILVEDVATDTPLWAMNTDGIDPMNSTHVIIRRAFIVNGDDSIAVKDGCRDVLVEDCTLVNGKGLCVGSLGKNGAVAAVEDIVFRNNRLINTTHGIIVKTWPGGGGFARNLTWTNITFDRVTLALQVTAWYCIDDPEACKPRPGGVNVSGVTFQGLAGTHNHTLAALLNCSASLPCTALALEDVNLVPYQGWSPKQNVMECVNAYGSSTNVTQPISCLFPAPL